MKRQLMDKVNQVVGFPDSGAAYHAVVTGVRLVGNKQVGNAFVNGSNRKVALLRDQVWLVQ